MKEKEKTKSLSVCIAGPKVCHVHCPMLNANCKGRIPPSLTRHYLRNIKKFSPRQHIPFLTKIKASQSHAEPKNVSNFINLTYQ